MSRIFSGYKTLVFAIALFIASLAPLSASAGNNLHLLDSNPATGFGIYRTGEPSAADMRELCQLGVREMMVLSGTAAVAEYKYQNECPTLRVIYNEKQDADVALTEGFLNQFDQWVDSAKQRGIKIAFRCNCGCHRTGRLAAYFQMKYLGYTPGLAIQEMKNNGRIMFLYPGLSNQVYALYDHIMGRACTEKEKFCVQEGAGKPLKNKGTLKAIAKRAGGAVTSLAQTTPGKIVTAPVKLAVKVVKAPVKLVGKIFGGKKSPEQKPAKKQAKADKKAAKKQKKADKKAAKKAKKAAKKAKKKK